jgi:hypothetical protein
MFGLMNHKTDHMDDEALHALLTAVIHRERDAGCCMADESLIGPAIRRWKSYERRHRRSKMESLETRAADLKKGFLSLFPAHDYDAACLGHIAESFAAILSGNTQQIEFEDRHVNRQSASELNTQ